MPLFHVKEQRRKFQFFRRPFLVERKINLTDFLFYICLATDFTNLGYFNTGRYRHTYYPLHRYSSCELSGEKCLVSDHFKLAVLRSTIRFYGFCTAIGPRPAPTVFSRKARLKQTIRVQAAYKKNKNKTQRFRCA